MVMIDDEPVRLVVYAGGTFDCVKAFFDWMPSATVTHRLDLPEDVREIMAENKCKSAFFIECGEEGEFETRWVVAPRPVLEFVVRKHDRFRYRAA